MATNALTRATYRVTQETLEEMVLAKNDFPGDFQAHQVVREGELDNERLARNGFPGNTAERFRLAGRVTGNMRELGPTSEMAIGRRKGGPSSGPLVAARPDIAWVIRSKPPREP